LYIWLGFGIRNKNKYNMIIKKFVFFQIMIIALLSCVLAEW
jgi:hypothetical protein